MGRCVGWTVPIHGHDLRMRFQLERAKMIALSGPDVIVHVARVLSLGVALRVGRHAVLTRVQDAPVIATTGCREEDGLR